MRYETKQSLSCVSRPWLRNPTRPWGVRGGARAAATLTGVQARRRSGHRHMDVVCVAPAWAKRPCRMRSHENVFFFICVPPAWTTRPCAYLAHKVCMHPQTLTHVLTRLSTLVSQWRPRDSSLCPPSESGLKVKGCTYVAVNVTRLVHRPYA